MHYSEIINNKHGLHNSLRGLSLSLYPETLGDCESLGDIFLTVILLLLHVGPLLSVVVLRDALQIVHGGPSPGCHGSVGTGTDPGEKAGHRSITTKTKPTQETCINV